MFVLDSSGSIDRARFSTIKEKVVTVVNDLDVRMDRTRVGLIYWSNEAFVAFNMNDYGQVKQDVVEAIRRVPYLGNMTHTAAALRLLRNTAFRRQNGDRDGVLNVAVVVGDGNSNVEEDMTPVEAALCRMNGIRMVVAVIYDDQVDISELATIASRPLSENLLMSSTHHLVDNVTTALIAATCDGIDFLYSRLNALIFVSFL